MNHLRKYLFLPVLLSLLFFACNEEEPAKASIDTIERTAWEGAMYPDIVIGPDGAAYITYLKPIDSLQYGLYLEKVLPLDELTAPILVASDSNWFVNWADFPTLAVTPELMVVSWLKKSAEGTFDYDIMVALSADKGANWSAPTKLHNDTVHTEHGFVTLAAHTDGSVQAVWLDGRNAGGGHEGHHGHGAMSLRAARILPDGTITSRVELDNRVCDCCQTDLVMSTAGPVVAYRDRMDPEIRDISLAVLRDTVWETGLRVGDDNWDIAACPVNGPALDAREDKVLVARFTGAQGDARVLVTTHDLSTGVEGKSLRMDNMAPIGRVDASWLPDGHAVVSWVERDKEHAALRLAILDMENGLVQQKVRVADYDPARISGFPRMKVIGETIYLIYSQTRETHGKDQIIMQRVIFS